MACNESFGAIVLTNENKSFALVRRGRELASERALSESESRTLRSDAVIADNPPVHEVRSTRKLLEDAGTELLFLPQNGPEPNSVETVFAG